VIDLVGELDTVFSGDKPATGRVADQIRNPPGTDFWTLQIVGSVGCRGRATQEDEKHDPKSDALPLRSAGRRSGRTRLCKFWRTKATEHPECHPDGVVHQVAHGALLCHVNALFGAAIGARRVVGSLMPRPPGQYWPCGSTFSIIRSSGTPSVFNLL